MKNKKIYYWSPFISHIATIRAAINSASSLLRYSSNYDCYLFNFFGEFNIYKTEIEKKNINLLNYYKTNLAKYLPYRGKINSRLSFIIIFILGFFPLKKILKTNKPDFLIIHLISSLPLILLILFNFDTKFILRISGFPKMNFFRKFLWKLAFNKIHIITCPTENTLNYMKKLNLTDSSKIKLLYDPVLIVKEINRKKKQENLKFKNYFLSVGRLTRQKNFLFLCKAFKKIVDQNKNYKLVIAGEGEDKNKLKNFIDKNNLNNNIILLGHVENIYPYFVNSNGFILSSLWEDPGFVLVEAAFCRKLVLTSNSWPGPVELIKDSYNGIIYENNNINSFIEKFDLLINYKDKKLLKLNNLKNIKKFTIFNHYKSFDKLLS